jgi:hypothetical protein
LKLADFLKFPSFPSQLASRCGQRHGGPTVGFRSGASAADAKANRIKAPEDFKDIMDWCTNFMHDMTMFEWNREVDAMELRNTMKGNGNAENSSKTPLEAMVSRQVSTINLQLNGQPYGQVNTDPAGAASLNQFLGELSRQKGASSS